MKITKATQQRHSRCLSKCGGPWLWAIGLSCVHETHTITVVGWHIWTLRHQSFIYICPYSHQSLVGEQHTWKPILSNPLVNHLLFLSIQVSWWLTYLRSIFPTRYGQLSTCQFKFTYKSRFLSVLHLVKWTRKLQERVCRLTEFWVSSISYKFAQQE